MTTCGFNCKILVGCKYMDNKYYDEWEFHKVQSLRNFNPKETVEKFEQYLKEYPNDYSAYCYYASSLVTIGKLEEAEKVIDYVEKRGNKDKNFASKEPYKMKALKFSVLYNKLRIYSYKGEYQKVYNLCVNNPEEIKHLNMNDLMFYIRKKLGKVDANKRNKNSYLFRQIVSYKEEDFLEHIKKHLADYNSDLDNPNKNIFVPNFPLEDILEEVRKNIPSNKKMCTGFWENTYIFRCDECGRENNRLVNYFKVVCFDKTCDIITILPVSGCEYLPQVDLSHLMKKESKEIKRESAIERFNRRYKRN